jgi:hypothetical protein
VISCMHSQVAGIAACTTAGMPRRTRAIRAPNNGLKRRPIMSMSWDAATSFQAAASLR